MARFTLAALLLLSAALAACNGGDDGDAASTVTSTPASTSTPAATATAAPTSTPIPPPEVVASARVITTDLNVRVGPGLNYPVLGVLQPDDEVEVAGRAASDPEWLALADIGWVFYQSDWLELDIAVTALPEVQDERIAGLLHPAGARTGIDGVDAVLEAALAGDVDALVALAATHELECAEAPGVGGVPCAPGVTPGTTVEVFPAGNCEVEQIAPDEVRDSFARLLAPPAGGSATSPRLYAVAATSPGEASDFAPAGDYLVILAFAGGEGRALWVDAAGAIVRTSMFCGTAAPYTLRVPPDQDARSFVFGPVVPAPLDPP